VTETEREGLLMRALGSQYVVTYYRNLQTGIEGVLYALATNRLSKRFPM
jgi:hypothetical protein